MITGCWGKKIGMTQVFQNDKVIPVTVVDVSDWLVTNIRNQERDGYGAIQVGLKRPKCTGDAFSKLWLKDPRAYFSFVREIKAEEELPNIAVGQSIDFCKQFKEGEKVDVFGKSRGLGFAGVVKRHGFNGPPGSHGSTMGKRTGSIGFFRSEGRVIKGKKMPGHKGNVACAIRGLEIIMVKPEEKVLVIKGSVPGKSGSLLFIRKA